MDFKKKYFKYKYKYNYLKKKHYGGFNYFEKLKESIENKIIEVKEKQKKLLNDELNKKRNELIKCKTNDLMKDIYYNNNPTAKKINKPPVDIFENWIPMDDELTENIKKIINQLERLQQVIHFGNNSDIKKIQIKQRNLQNKDQKWYPIEEIGSTAGLIRYIINGRWIEKPIDYFESLLYRNKFSPDAIPKNDFSFKKLYENDEYHPVAFQLWNLILRGFKTFDYEDVIGKEEYDKLKPDEKEKYKWNDGIWTTNKKKGLITEILEDFNGFSQDAGLGSVNWFKRDKRGDTNDNLIEIWELAQKKTKAARDEDHAKYLENKEYYEDVKNKMEEIKKNPSNYTEDEYKRYIEWEYGYDIYEDEQLYDYLNDVRGFYKIFSISEVIEKIEKINKLMEEKIGLWKKLTDEHQTSIREKNNELKEERIKLDKLKEELEEIPDKIKECSTKLEQKKYDDSLIGSLVNFISR